MTYIECPECCCNIYICRKETIADENKRISDELTRLQCETLKQESISRTINEMPKSTWFEDMIKEKQNVSKKV